MTRFLRALATSVAPWTIIGVLTYGAAIYLWSYVAHLAWYTGLSGGGQETSGHAVMRFPVCGETPYKYKVVRDFCPELDRSTHDQAIISPDPDR